MMSDYEIRAHHGMCLAFFEGKGYSNQFTEHMGEMRRILDANPKVSITARTDAICAACPNNENGSCNTASKVENYDRKVLAFCGMKEGDELSWHDYAQLVRKSVLEAGRREEICGDCQWDSICGKTRRMNV